MDARWGTLLVWLVAAPHVARADCPAPVVRIERIEEASDAPGRDQALHAVGYVGTSAANALAAEEGVRFAPDDGLAEDFVVVLDGKATRRASRPGWAYGHVARLTDGRGRTLASGSVTYALASDPGTAELDRAASGLARQVSPLLEAIRVHQRQTRDQDASAILPALVLEPARVEVAPGVVRPVSLRLTDCDGVALPNRPVAIELSGPGHLDRAQVVTDALGRAELVYTAVEPGTARLSAVWPHADTDGDRALVTAVAEIVVRRE